MQAIRNGGRAGKDGPPWRTAFGRFRRGPGGDAGIVWRFALNKRQKGLLPCFSQYLVGSVEEKEKREGCPYGFLPSFRGVVPSAAAGLGFKGLMPTVLDIREG